MQCWPQSLWSRLICSQVLSSLLSLPDEHTLSRTLRRWSFLWPSPHLVPKWTVRIVKCRGVGHLALVCVCACVCVISPTIYIFPQAEHNKYVYVFLWTEKKTYPNFPTSCNSVGGLIKPNLQFQILPPERSIFLLRAKWLNYLLSQFSPSDAPGISVL